MRLLIAGCCCLCVAVASLYAIFFLIVNVYRPGVWWLYPTIGLLALAGLLSWPAAGTCFYLYCDERGWI